MWSLGVVVFALMGGRFPYKEVEPRALAEEARTTKLYFPPTPWSGISDDGVFSTSLVPPLLTLSSSQIVYQGTFTSQSSKKNDCCGSFSSSSESEYLSPTQITNDIFLVAQDCFISTSITKISIFFHSSLFRCLLR